MLFKNRPFYSRVIAISAATLIVFTLSLSFLAPLVFRFGYEGFSFNIVYAQTKIFIPLTEFVLLIALGDFIVNNYSGNKK